MRVWVARNPEIFGEQDTPKLVGVLQHRVAPVEVDERENIRSLRT